MASPAASWPRHTIDDSSRGADGVRLADVNGDGFSDIVVATHDQGVVAVLYGDASGSLTAEELDAEERDELLDWLRQEAARLEQAVRYGVDIIGHANFLDDEALDMLRDWQRRFADSMTATERAFAEASDALARQSRRRRRG